jgi:hypothetical protein
MAVEDRFSLEELHNNFRLEGEVLYRLNKGEWTEFIQNPISNGYSIISFRGVCMSTHRLIWTLVNGRIPDGLCIDHINGDRVDNRIDNMRVVTVAENNANQECHRKGQPFGITLDKASGLWQAQVTRDKRVINIGRYALEEEAAKAVVDFCNTPVRRKKWTEGYSYSSKLDAFYIRRMVKGVNYYTYYANAADAKQAVREDDIHAGREPRYPEKGS